ARVGSRWFRGSGTSQSAAVVSGTVAALLQARPELRPDQVKQLLMASAVPLAGADPAAQGAGKLSVKGLDRAAAPTGAQTFAPATGLGSLEAARGSRHVTMDGVALEGEQDIFGQPWDAGAWAAASASGTSWSDGAWNATSWSGTSWSGTSWSGTSWSGTSWSGTSWSGTSWSGTSWSSNVWTGTSWSGTSWSGTSWSGTSWSNDIWRGTSWTGTSWTGTSWSGTSWSGTSWSGTSWSTAAWPGEDGQ
ncbi:MAG: S8 family serine peptidase, partial [Acidimicrobiales bacterium]